MIERFLIKKIFHRNSTNDWSVASAKCIKQKEEEEFVTTIIGFLPGVTDFMRIECEGQWKEHEKYGTQFVIESWKEIMPMSIDGLERYLSGGTIKGIGPALAKRIVEKFGLNVPDIMDNDIRRLLEVEGIGEAKLAKINQGWKAHREISDIMIFLQGCGASSSLANKIWRKYGSDSIRIVKENPYRLANEVWGIGFITADEIARSMGFPLDSQKRLASGLKYTLEKLSEEGHVYASRDSLIEKAVELLKVEWAPVENTLNEVLKNKELVQDGEAIYHPSLYRAETRTVSRLLKISSFPCRNRELSEEQIKKALSSSGLEYDTKQREAIEASIKEKIIILTGGPGTGKTTTVNGIIKVFRAMGLSIQLAAPTGRAAKRMTEATGIEATTIHRLLEYNPMEGFTRHSDNPIEGDALILDECSMIDISLMSTLLCAIPDRMRLVFVGDIDQLPSVGPGNVLRDMIDSAVFKVIKLDLNHRQAQKSRIIYNAHQINAGHTPELTNTPGSDFWFIEESDQSKVAKTITDLVKTRLPGYCTKQFNKEITWQDIQVLSPMRKGLAGTANLNTMLQAALNPEGDFVQAGEKIIRINDKVMQIRNNYAKGVFNGTTGIVKYINKEDKEITIQFEGYTNPITYDFNELEEIVLSYATTIHKSQGSEYPVVVMPINMGFYCMLQRNLIYTGVTRARKMLVLVGEKKAVGYGVHNLVVVNRNTKLKERLEKKEG